MITHGFDKAETSASAELRRVVSPEREQASSARGFRPIRVLQVHATPFSNAGSEVSLRLSLMGLRQEGIESTVLCAESPSSTSAIGAENVVVRPDLFVSDPASPMRVRKMIRGLLSVCDDVGVDLVHVRLGLRPEIILEAARRRSVIYSAHLPVCPNGARHFYRERIVCDRAVGLSCLTSGYVLHGCGHLVTGAPVSPQAFARALLNTRRLLRALKACASVISPSHWQADRLIADGVPSENIVVVPPPILSNSLRVSHPAVGSVSVDGAHDLPAVAFAGRLVSVKGADHLLLASSQIHTPHQVWIVGDGPQRGELELLATGLGIADRVTFWGALSPQGARERMGQAEVVVVPSLCGETFNQVGAQAAAAGQPVVGYAAGGMVHWARQYSTVRLVPVGEREALASAIARALSGPHAADVPGNRFSLAGHTTLLAQIYTGALSG